ncbi:DUF2520 domain-containing protein [Microbacterium sp. CFBP9034]|uniref:DUF2520 domain-containing protein n=1 Tax=Microbacterium sp. CFBP9034 TaxID=3096540 RepID=UPI002A6B3108|nr:DUF2520 domain-containing protein [Microbacterium sp. CFBP9034]MDY0910184.1 DUF2520 domain-containing protein [Microbacterium sp. CFBP9034]
MNTTNQRRTVASISVVGPGRVGRAAALALRSAGFSVSGPSGRRDDIVASEVVLVCVPDREIAAAVAASRDRARFVGHTSGATSLAAVAADFSVHPLRAFTGHESADAFEGIGCAVAGATPDALAVATELALALGGEPFAVSEEQRAGYHAAASIASNFLVTLAAAAEQMGAASGLPSDEFRRHLVPLVRGTVDNWAEHGPRAALTGPIARGDERTVERQRAAVAEAAPELLALFDELSERTRALARTETPE